MSHQIYIQCNFFSAPWEGSATAAAAASPSATPIYYQLINEGHVKAQFHWNGQIIPVVGGYQAYVTAPTPTPAKVEEKPFPRRARKRVHSSDDTDEEQGCTPPKIRRLEPSAKPLPTQKPARTAMSKRRARR
ncbi:DPEP2 neighbor protein-like [Manis pentadactyla]|uniref:DPEP2 neighbor protein-like n=1 Tax=Manis pentadactyla TaxID=143292 RepID=UPI00255C717F|nr:DPEP2 neighbor protein-like [Manis pentadactyla]XP_057348862.1 DPEP2 neighbor protein-like [Manis pentadactyla]